MVIWGAFFKAAVAFEHREPWGAEWRKASYSNVLISRPSAEIFSLEGSK